MNPIKSLISDTSLLAALTAPTDVSDKQMLVEIRILNNNLRQLARVIDILQTELHDFRFELIPYDVRALPVPTSTVVLNIPEPPQPVDTEL